MSSSTPTYRYYLVPTHHRHLTSACTLLTCPLHFQPRLAIPFLRLVPQDSVEISRQKAKAEDEEIFNANTCNHSTPTCSCQRPDLPFQKVQFAALLLWAVSVLTQQVEVLLTHQHNPTTPFFPSKKSTYPHHSLRPPPKNYCLRHLGSPTCCLLLALPYLPYQRSSYMRTRPESDPTAYLFL